MTFYNMKLFFKIFVLSIAILLLSDLSGQENRFSASIVGGITAAQLSGDSLLGYEKLGFTIGGKISYPISKKMDLSGELLYSQRGSRSGIGFSSSGGNATMLNYLEIPIYVTFNDWYIEKDDYHKVGIWEDLFMAISFQQVRQTAS